MTNEELIQKAIIIAENLASGGKLNPQQSDKFLDYVYDETVMKGNARTLKVVPDELEIDKIGIGQRVAVPKDEAKDPGVRMGVSTGKVLLAPREIMVPLEISDNFKESNIEGDSVEDHIIRMFAKRLANNLEELWIGGDTLGPAAIQGDIYPGGSTSHYVKDSYMALHNGWIRLADSGHIADMEGQNIGLKVFRKILTALPTAFRRNKADLRWFISPDLWEVYLEKLSTRATSLGDAAAGGGQHNPLGISAVQVPLLQEYPTVVQHVQLNGTTAVSLRYKPISAVVVTKETLGKVPESAYLETTDYTVNYSNGTIARVGGGAIGDGDTVKVTFRSNPQIILTHRDNFIVGIGRDVRIEKDRDIYKTVNQYAITVKASVQFEEADALSKGINIGAEV